MANILEGVRGIYKRNFEDYIDPINQESFLSTYTFYITFVVVYISTVKLLGPAFMEKRQPFNIQKVLIVYNCLQIIINLYILYESIIIYLGSSDYICITTTEREVFDSARRHYMYLKMFDCTETVFFVLRKSYRQMSFLHVYHHCGILFGAWFCCKFYWGDTVVIVSLLNCVTHSLMFTYYLLTSLDPKWKHNLIMKKSVTIIQIVQLIMMCLYFAITVLLLPECNGKVAIYPGLLWIINNIFMVNLFIRFYVETYMKSEIKKNIVHKF